MVHSRIFPVLLVIGLLLGQLAQLVHASDLDAHDGGHACELCLLSHLHHQAGAPDSPVPLPVYTYDLVAAVPAGTPARSHACSQQARAPPPASLVR